MPDAIYRSGETVFPVWPTWCAYGIQPASTAARLAPTAAPRVWARARTGLEPSRPPPPDDDARGGQAPPALVHHCIDNLNRNFALAQGRGHAGYTARAGCVWFW